MESIQIYIKDSQEDLSYLQLLSSRVILQQRPLFPSVKHSKPRRTKRAVLYYSNSTATTQLIIKDGDIETNPGPESTTSGKSKADSSSQRSKTNTANNRNIKISHLNVRSLKNRQHFLLVKDIILKYKYDVFTVSETWLKDVVPDLELEIPGYNLFRLDRPGRKCGGGVCAYILQSLKVEVLRDISKVSDAGFHQLWVKIQVRNLKSFVVCTIYRPPDTPSTCFESELSPSFINASLLNKPIYILGDANSNLLNPQCPDSAALLAFINLFNLTQLIKLPTRVTQTTESLLDIILASNTKQVKEAKVIPCSVSDHDLIYANLELKQARLKPTYIYTRSFKTYNRDSFLEEVEKIPWSVMDIFNSLLLDVLDQHAPLRTIKDRGRANPFVTEHIRELMKTRDVYQKLARRTKDPLAWNAFKNFNREVKREIRMEEKRYVMEQVSSNKNNSNSLWKTIRSCLPKRSRNAKTYSKDDQVTAEEFNEYFINVGKNTVNKINDLAAKLNYDLSSANFQHQTFTIEDQFTFGAVREKDVESIIKGMTTNKAPGYDKIPVRVIKDSLPAILPAVTDLINSSFQTSVFPNKWKIAEVLPIHKDGDHELPMNNRPISLLPVLSKICERVAYDQLTAYIQTNNRMSSSQSGCREYHSTETSVLYTTDHILQSIDNKKLSAVVLLDMSKAFDSINHQRLLLRLQHAGASPPVLTWMLSYLSNRYQAVRINTSLSTLSRVENGSAPRKYSRRPII